MDYTAAKFWFDVAQTAFMFFVSVYIWWVGRSRVTRAAIESISERVAKHEIRLQLHEQKAGSVPNHNDIGEIHNRVDQVGQGVKQIEGQIVQINHTMHLIQQHLLERSK